MTSPKGPLEWSPPLALIAIGWFATVGAATFAVLTSDNAGRVLLGIAALVAALLSLHGTVARPRLAADHAGVTVRGLAGRRHWSWGEINVRVARTRRLGRDVATLELDSEADLVVLGWIDLGTHPDEVHEALAALRT